MNICGGGTVNFTEAEKQKFANQLAAAKQISAEQAQKNRDAITKVWSGAEPVMELQLKFTFAHVASKVTCSLLGRNIMFIDGC